MIIWTDYMKYRANLRGYDLSVIEDILRYNEERYFDMVTGRYVVIGVDMENSLLWFLMSKTMMILYQ